VVEDIVALKVEPSLPETRVNKVNKKDSNRETFLFSKYTMADPPTKQKLWGGRFTGKTDPLYVQM